MGAVVYALCSAAAALCAALLLRSYTRSRAPLLLWSGLCFVAFTVNNILVFVDLVLVPSVDLFLLRNLVALIGIALLLWGLIWESL
jgi:hypothetical protein